MGPVVSGGRRLDTTWEVHNRRENGIIYKANIDNQVSVVPGLQLNGVRATRARYPNLPAGIEVTPGYDNMVKGKQAVWTPPNFDKFGPVVYYQDNITEHYRDTAVDGWYNHYMVGINGLCSVYDRQPYLTTVRTGEPSMQMAWREIHHNFLLDNYSPQEGVDNDDGSAYYNTHDNFMVYGGQGLKSDFGGHDNHHTNNIYAYVKRALWSHTHTFWPRKL